VTRVAPPASNGTFDQVLTNAGSKIDRGPSFGDVATTPGGLDIVNTLRAEREALVHLLTGLSEVEWRCETECPAWSVQGIATDLIGDDLSLVSRQRDGAPSGLRQIAPSHPEPKFLELLNVFNEGWVTTAAFFSSSVVVELLVMTGKWTADFYGQQDPSALGEPVFWAGPDPAPYSKIAQREYGERGLHHMQIARATGHRGPVDEFLRGHATAPPVAFGSCKLDPSVSPPI
jgi:hypothetical protein